MLYKRNEEKVLDEALFRNPTSEYRGAPFWAWNCKMNKEMLCEQIEAMKKMGFGRKLQELITLQLKIMG